jgi:catechol-2,3-dioxygenase
MMKPIRKGIYPMNEPENQNRAPKLTSIGVVFRHVKDVAAACDFYGNSLGLKQLWKAPNGATAFTTGSGPIIIVDKKHESIESEVPFNMEISDISHAYRSMKENGIDVSDLKIAGNSSMFFSKIPMDIL